MPAAREGAGDLRCADGWARQGEQSAGRLRIALMWWIYRIFGKPAQKLATIPVMLFI